MEFESAVAQISFSRCTWCPPKPPVNYYFFLFAVNHNWMYMSMQTKIKYLQVIFLPASVFIFGLHPFFLLFVNRMQTSRRWFLIIPFCYLQRERNLACCSGQTGLCQDERCIKLQRNHANRVRWANAKDKACTCLWITHGIKHQLHSFHNDILLLCFRPIANGHLCCERCFILPRPSQDLVPLMKWMWVN